MEDFTFSDGTRIPKGQVVGAAIGPLQHDNKYYPDGDRFLPFRFVGSKTTGDDAGEGSKNGFVNPTPLHLTFGSGHVSELPVGRHSSRRCT